MSKDTVNNRQKFYQDRFLEYFVKYAGHIGKAASSTGVNRRTVELWRSKNKEFFKRFEEARIEVVEILEAEAYRRAVKGIKKPITYQGEIKSYCKEYSDTLLIVLLKANAPEKYRDNVKNEQTGEVTIRHVYDNPPPGN